jgi:hypothetical protein
VFLIEAGKCPIRRGLVECLVFCGVQQRPLIFVLHSKFRLTEPTDSSVLSTENVVETAIICLFVETGFGPVFDAIE